jgi:hypothetical protein
MHQVGDAGKLSVMRFCLLPSLLRRLGRGGAKAVSQHSDALLRMRDCYAMGRVFAGGRVYAPHGCSV